METRRPLIVDIRRDSLENGPGIRTVVFFKGCPLRCAFCHNPETQEAGPEIAFADERCIRCSECVKACPRAAIDLESKWRIDRTKCDGCGQCVGVCRDGALRLIGEYLSVERLAEFLLRDASFYRHSGGGVTLSGGECTMFPEYLQDLLQRLKAHGVHIALETSGYFEYEPFARKLLPYLDLILFDVKIVNRDESARFLGRSNERILRNLLSLLAQDAVEVHTRIPLIPGITDGYSNLAATVDFLCAAGAKRVSLLPYNPLGLATYRRLGRAGPDLPSSFTKPEREQQLVNMLRGIIAERTKQLHEREKLELEIGAWTVTNAYGVREV